MLNAPTAWAMRVLDINFEFVRVQTPCPDPLAIGKRAFTRVFEVIRAVVWREPGSAHLVGDLPRLGLRLPLAPGADGLAIAGSEVELRDQVPSHCYI